MLLQQREMPVKKLFDNGEREVIFFIYVSYLTRESTLYFLNVNKYWHDRKRWEKEANIVKGARFCYCRSNMKPARPWMLAHLKIIWQFHQKVSRFFGPRYIGDDLFLGPNLVSFNRAVVPLLELSFLTKSQKLTSA